MDLVELYQCFSDRTRLRILQVLAEGPLCVCHFQEVLGEPQVKISKHLGYLKTRGLVQARREGNWMVYQLPGRLSPPAKINLAGLQASVRNDALFKRDRARLKALRPSFTKTGPLCSPRS